MHLRLCVFALAMMVGPALAEPRSYSFVWEGEGGYSMTGALSFDSDLLEGAYVREADLTCFVIVGEKDGEKLGRWALTMLDLDTTWRFHFDPRTESFPVDGDSHEIYMPQAWNMDGEGRNCGPRGFGFNAGNFAQDLCINGALISASQVPPETPFPALRADVEFPADACRVPPLLSEAPHAQPLGEG